MLALMVLITWPMAAVAARIHHRRRAEEIRLWNERWGKRNPEPPHHRPIT